MTIQPDPSPTLVAPGKATVRYYAPGIGYLQMDAEQVTELDPYLSGVINLFGADFTRVN